MIINHARQPKYNKVERSVIKAKIEVVEQIKPLLYSQGFRELKRPPQDKNNKFRELTLMFCQINGIEIRVLALILYHPELFNMGINVYAFDKVPESVEEIYEKVPIGYSSDFFWFKNYKKSLLFKILHLFRNGYYKFGLPKTKENIEKEKEKLFKALTADFQPASLDKIFTKFIRVKPIIVRSLDGTYLRYYNKYQENQ